MKYALSSVLLLTVFTVKAQKQTVLPDSLASGVIHQVGVEFRPNYVTPTKDFFKGNNQAGKPIRGYYSAHLKYAFRFSNHTEPGRLYPYAYQGVGVSYGSFLNSRELGNPLTVYVFQGSRIARLASNLSLDYEWNFGASFGWKPRDEVDNAFNQVVGSKINAYLNLGILVDWRFAPQWNLTAGIDLTHFSNGNTHYPNAGVNPVGVRVGVTRTWGAEGGGRLADSPRTTFRPFLCYDVLLYGACRMRGVVWKDNAYLLPGKFAVAGFNFAPMYHWNKNFAAGISLDAQYDESANLTEHVAGVGGDGEIKFHRPPLREQLSLGLSCRGELVTPIFSLNAGLGYNVVHTGGDTKGFYQVLALKALLGRHLFLHVGYQLRDFHEPNNLMLGVGFRFR